MTLTPKLRSSFVLRVLSRGKQTCFEVHNLHTCQKLYFETWEQLQRYLEKTSQPQNLH